MQTRAEPACSNIIYEYKCTSDSGECVTSYWCNESTPIPSFHVIIWYSVRLCMISTSSSRDLRLTFWNFYVPFPPTENAFYSYVSRSFIKMAVSLFISTKSMRSFTSDTLYLRKEETHTLVPIKYKIMECSGNIN